MLWKRWERFCLCCAGLSAIRNTQLLLFTAVLNISAFFQKSTVNSNIQSKSTGKGERNDVSGIFIKVCGDWN